MQEIQERHRKELKDLRANIQQLKKSVGGSKQRKKEVAVEIAKLESEMEARHVFEISAVEGASMDIAKDEDADITEGVEDITNGIASITEMTAENVASLPTHEKKPNRQQLRKQRKQEETAEIRRLAEIEAANGVDHKKLESEAMRDILSHLKLDIHEVSADGHCLYNAISHQLSLQGIAQDFKQVRKIAADYLRSHSDDFIPFLSFKNESDRVMSAEEFEKYCDTVENTAEWGSQLEIKAVSESLGKQINVVQSSLPIVKTGEQFNDISPLNISYHRHEYGLGEHYNSLLTKQ